ncbi:MAG TPA: 3'-5' exonuclease, partial [Gammaproteobacteria bacterium]|nr:3'-5' exonuclease [Gammaproteobacteria bacterium]
APDREIIEAAWIRASEPTDDRLASPLIGDEVFCQRYKPVRPITLASLSVHHILPSELDGCPPSSECKLPADTTYIIGANIDFDWEAIGKPDVKRIDTCAMARYVYTEADSHTQSALLYHVLGAKPGTRERLKNAHSALADVENNVVLLEHLLRDAPKSIATWSELHAYSEECRIPRLMPLGDKQGLKGLTLDDAVKKDRGFCDWVCQQKWADAYLVKGIKLAIERGQGRRRA